MDVEGLYNEDDEFAGLYVEEVVEVLNVDEVESGL